MEEVLNLFNVQDKNKHIDYVRVYVHTRKPLCPEVSLDFFTVKECGLFICIKYINLIFYGCKQEIPNLKPNLQITSELGKMCA